MIIRGVVDIPEISPDVIGDLIPWEVVEGLEKGTWKEFPFEEFLDTEEDLDEKQRN